MNVRLIFAFSRAILNDKGARRKIMFYASLVTLILLFAGAVILSDFLQRSWILFTGYWGICLLGTVFMIMMAFYDMLAVRASHQSEMRRLKKRMRGIIDEAPDSK
jgi:protein-S-isoprenylcysteine O-methyltransferase Ste14